MKSAFIYFQAKVSECGKYCDPECLPRMLNSDEIGIGYICTAFEFDKSLQSETDKSGNILTLRCQQCLDAEIKNSVGAVLAYTTTGHHRVCGTTIGADGSGTFAVIFHGNAESADVAARKYISDMEKGGYRLREVLLIPNEELYSGPAIEHVTISKDEVSG
jgi:hypothetical protein